MRRALFFTGLLGPLVPSSLAQSLQNCPGYKLSSVTQLGSSLTADLTLAGSPCNVYGTDLKDLKLQVDYETDYRLHVKIYDVDEQVYQVPESVFPRPSSGNLTGNNTALRFDYIEQPFSFSVSRTDTKEVLFNTSISNLVFESQYVNLRTSLPDNPNLYGLGEHSDPFHLETTSYVRTLWSRDAYGIPAGTNLYGNHPVYIDHRGAAGTHGVFLLSSNGMDIKIDKTQDGTQYLEYNTLGGIVDLYFFAGPTPKEVTKQYASVAGLPVMMSYWTFGFHQCRYGYQDIYEVAEVVYNYTQANIPLETMWTDIDYMMSRITFTTDSQRFPVSKMRELVSYLHTHEQHYILMVDPATSVSDNGAYNRGSQKGIFLKLQNGSFFEGVVWPGVTVFPDWFNEDTQGWWNNEFNIFFDPETGIDIDGLWIDMNEASNFCPWPCTNPTGYAQTNDYPPAAPPVRPNPRPLPGFPADFQPPSTARLAMAKRQAGNGTVSKVGLPGRDLLTPPYSIRNAAGALSSNTIETDLIHASVPYAEYDTHNLYGTMMSADSRVAMLQRRPKVRPLVITRSTFSGAGAHVGHWLGDNLSTWDKYRISIAQMLSFASIFQLPMVGSDVCGYGGTTNEILCARWAMLGAFYPFYRNHNELGKMPQEFYRWTSVAEAARTAIDIRYRLLDYLYTAFHRQTVTGEPFLQPLFYLYPRDNNTFPIDLQFFFGDAVLVSPVTADDSSAVDAYFPNDIFYDWYTGAPFPGNGTNITISNVNLTSIPLHIRGGNIIPARISGANTTTELRKKAFNIIIAPSLNGTAKGSLYMDDGDSLEQQATLDVTFDYSPGTLRIESHGEFDPGVSIELITILGQDSGSKNEAGGNGTPQFQYDSSTKVLSVGTSLSLLKSLEVPLS